MSSGEDGSVDEQVVNSPHRIMFDPEDINGTPMSFEDNRAVETVATTMTDVTDVGFGDDESVASEGVEAPLRNRGRQIIEGVERDKRGCIIRTCMDYQAVNIRLLLREI